jgi:hypothetical protein
MTATEASTFASSSTAMMAEVKEHSDPDRSAGVSIPISYVISWTVGSEIKGSAYSIVEQAFDDFGVHLFILVHLPDFRSDDIFSVSPH